MTPAELVAQRKAHGLTQAQLAAHMGTTRNTIARWEMGQVKITEGWLRLAFEVLDLRRR